MPNINISQREYAKIQKIASMTGKSVPAVANGAISTWWEFDGRSQHEYLIGRSAPIERLHIAESAPVLAFRKAAV